MLPVSTPPNAMAFATGRLQVSDMAGVGLCLNALGIVTVLLALHTIGEAIFQLHEVPAWANATASEHGAETGHG